MFWVIAAFTPARSILPRLHQLEYHAAALDPAAVVATLERRPPVGGVLRLRARAGGSGPEPAARQGGTRGQGLDPGPGDLPMDAPAEPAIGRGDDPFAADETGET